MASTALLGARLLSESPPLEFTRAGELNFSRVGFAWPIGHWTAFIVKGAHVFLLLADIHHVTTISEVLKLFSLVSKVSEVLSLFHILCLRQ